MAFAWQNREQDCVLERVICDNDYSEFNHGGFCSGEFQLVSKNNLEKNGDGKVKAKCCSYFRDSRDI